MRLTAAVLAIVFANCGHASPCDARPFAKTLRISARYAGRWQVVFGDTVTIAQMGDRFRLREIDLDTARVLAREGTACRLTGALLFQEPRRDTFPVTWVGFPEQALIYGWPADLGPFGGIGATLHGDTLVGSLLFQSEVGINVPPGVTARFVARRRTGR